MIVYSSRFPEAGGSAYLYFFNHTLDLLRYTRDEGLLGLGADFMGSFHGSELPFVFDVETALIKDEPDLALTMGEFWGSFAATGQPATTEVGATWNQYAAANDNNMNLNTPISSEVFENQVSFPHKARPSLIFSGRASRQTTVTSGTSRISSHG